VPSALGVLALLLTTWGLRMEELSAIGQWIRRRGWKRRGIEAVEAEESPGDWPSP
jgi:hypothetical protein